MRLFDLAMFNVKGGDVRVKPSDVAVQVRRVVDVRVAVARTILESTMVGFELRVFSQERLMFGGEFFVRHGCSDCTPHRSAEAFALHTVIARVKPSHG
jgi:hypothetical protein